jgi:hypothetical protein
MRREIKPFFSVPLGLCASVLNLRRVVTRPLLAAALGALCVAGCGYEQTGAPPQSTVGGYQWRSLYREDIRTVAVPIFTNRTYRRNLEFRLTDALIKQIEAHSPYKVVPRERAETVLEGEIVSVNIYTVSNDPRSAVPQEQLYTVVVDFTWKDQRNGRILVERRGFIQRGVHFGFEQSASYYPTLGEGQFIGSQQDVEGLARGIAQELQAEW